MEIKLIDNPVKLAEFLNNPANTGNIVDSGDKYYIKSDAVYLGIYEGLVLAGVHEVRNFWHSVVECHAVYDPGFRGEYARKEIGLAFWRYILTNTTVQCVTSFAARKFRHGQMYCAMIGLKRVGTIKKYFKGVDDVTFYSATREELIDFLNHGR
ncbi:DUF2824 family protein [Escherichia coli]|nr:DUF2824 family protein [Escherichia coli]